MPVFSHTRRFLGLLLALLVLAALAVPALADGGTNVAGAVLDSNGNPVAGATVELLRQGAGIVDSTAAGSDGGYRLSAGTTPGVDFKLRVWAAGFATAEQTWVPTVDSGRIDFSLSALSAAVAGRVLDGNNSPVAGVQVQVYRKGAGLAGSASSGADGRFSITGLRAGASYSLQALLAGYSLFQQALPALAGGGTLRVDPIISQATAQLSGQVVDGQTGAPVAGARVEVLRKGRGLVAEGDTDAAGNFAFTLPAIAAAEYQVRVFANPYAAYASALFALPGGSVRDLAGSDQIVLAPAFASVAGFLFDSSGIARAGVPVHLDKQGLGTIASTVTDSTGWYAITGVPASSDPTYRIRALPQSADSAVATDASWFALPGGVQYEADLSIAFLGASTVGQGTISGRVVDEAGRPLSGVTISAARAFNPGGNNTYTVTTDSNGHYRLDLPGNKPFSSSSSAGYILTATASGFFDNDQPALTLPQATTASLAPAATPAAAWVDVTPNKLTTANFSLKASKGRLSGRALDAQGRTVAGAQVSLLRDGKGSIMTATTDASGRFSFIGIDVVGRPAYLAEVRANGFLPSALAKDGGAGNWLVDAAGGLGTIQDVRLQATSATLAGAVVDDNGRAVAGATVVAADLTSGTVYKALSGSDGSYSISELPASGQSYAVSVSGEHMQGSALGKNGDLAAPVTPNPGDRLAADLLLVPDGAVLGGVVYGEDGNAVAGAKVVLWQEGVGAITTMYADSKGSYSFGSLQPGGRYAVRAWAEGFRPSDLKYGVEYIPGLVGVEGGDRLTWNIVLYR